MPGKLRTAQEAAEKCSTSVKFIYEMAAQGRLRRVKLGRLVRFRDEDIDAFIAEGTSGGDVRRGR